MKELRIAYVVVQPVLLWDEDGELSPGPQVAAIQVSIKDLHTVGPKMKNDVALKSIELSQQASEVTNSFDPACEQKI